MRQPLPPMAASCVVLPGRRTCPGCRCGRRAEYQRRQHGGEALQVDLALFVQGQIPQRALARVFDRERVRVPGNVLPGNSRLVERAGHLLARGGQSVRPQARASAHVAPSMTRRARSAPYWSVSIGSKKGGQLCGGFFIGHRRGSLRRRSKLSAFYYERGAVLRAATAPGLCGWRFGGSLGGRR